MVNKACVPFVLLVEGMRPDKHTGVTQSCEDSLCCIFRAKATLRTSQKEQRNKQKNTETKALTKDLILRVGVCCGSRCWVWQSLKNTHRWFSTRLATYDILLLYAIRSCDFHLACLSTRRTEVLSLFLSLPLSLTHDGFLVFLASLLNTFVYSYARF